jgi:hypothetical protein
MRKETKSLMSVAALGVALSSGATVAWAESASRFACTARADVPNSANDAVVGRSGCSTSIRVDGYIKEDRGLFPDSIVGRRTFIGGVAWVYGGCGNGVGSYYSEMQSSSGANLQSSRRTRCE